MTDIKREIFEKYEIRKSKKQKFAFIEYTLKKAAELGYKTAKIEKGSLGTKNIVIGKLSEAKVVYTAHYDTCAALPFPNFITPKNFTLYLLYQLLISFAMLIGALAISFITCLAISIAALTVNPSFDVGPIAALIPTLFTVLMITAFLWMLAGPANKHTANDNTSGVITLFEIMAKLPEDKRDEVCFVFFDLEEAGLIGSSAFAKKHKKEMKNKPLINFDCVSDGKNIIFALTKKAKHLEAPLEEAFASNEEFSVEVLTKGVFYPSDQANFKIGAGVAALLKSKKSGILYMNKIHTKKDTVFCDENIEFLSNGAKKLVYLLTSLDSI